MALMTKIRNNLAKLFMVLAIFFILYIFFDWGLDLTGRKGRGFLKGEVFAKVNGREITYKEFSDLLNQAIINWKKQNNKEDIDEQIEEQIRSEVWSQLVDQILQEQQIEKLGIKVSDEEIRDILTGPNPPEFLTSQFRDSTGTFHRDAYIAAIMDPQNKQILINVEEGIRRQLKYIKLQRLILASVQVSESELKKSFIEKNITLNADYVFFNVHTMISDTAVRVTEDDMRGYYESHPENFQSKPIRRLKYVSFSLSPSSADTNVVLDEMSRLLDQVKSGVASFEDLVGTYSELPSPDVYFKHNELSRQKEDAVFSAKKGDIVGPIIDYDGVHLIKIVDEKKGTEEFVRVSHILLRAIPGADSNKIISKAKDVLAKARRGEDFAKLARENSQDYTTAYQGGEIGWISKNGWEKPLTDAAFKAGKGQIIGPLRGKLGWHIIKVLAKDNREVKILDLAMKIKSSSETIDKAYEKAQDFIYLAKDEGFEKAASIMNIQIRETPEFNKGSYIPGLGLSDALSSFAWNNKLDAISEPIRLRNEIVVAKVSKIRDENMRSYEEVVPALRAMTLKEKKMNLLREQVDKFYNKLTPNADIISVAKSIPGVEAKNTGPFKPVDMIPGIGRDPAFIGTALSLQPGNISKPFEGENGYYIIKLISRTEFDTLKYNSEKDAIYRQKLQEKQHRTFSEWLQAMREQAKIIDNRSLYYR